MNGGHRLEDIEMIQNNCGISMPGMDVDRYVEYLKEMRVLWWAAEANHGFSSTQGWSAQEDQPHYLRMIYLESFWQGVNENQIRVLSRRF